MLVQVTPLADMPSARLARQNDIARPDESVRQPDKSVLAGTGRAAAKRSGRDDVLQTLLSWQPDDNIEIPLQQVYWHLLIQK